MNVKVLEKAVVLSNREIRPGIMSMWLSAPEIASHCQPGQFVHVRILDSFQPLLRRPISIGRVESETLELVWRIVGTGTDILAQRNEGEEVDLLGPLGRPFNVEGHIEEALLVGGGLGAPPIVYLHKELLKRGVKSTMLIGVQSVDALPLADDDPDLESITVVEEAGSTFRAGLVTEPLMEELARLKQSGSLSNTAVYSCGPWGLVGALQKVVPNDGLLRSEVSLEQQMGCGVGVCQGCAVVAEGGPTKYRLVCHDGPVFDLFGVEVPA